MSKPAWTIEEVNTADLLSADLFGIRHLMNAAFGDRFSEEDWDHVLGGRHFIVRESKGTIISHAVVIHRTVTVSGEELATGYVEGVATQPEFQGKGLATAVMRAVAEFIGERFQLGALSGIRDFYEKLGWQRWLGMTWCRNGEDFSRTAQEDGGIFVLPTQSTPPLDLNGDIAVEWREGDAW